MSNKQAKGFTLIELLIVIGIIAILATVVILTLNPAELLRQARDSTRVSDVATIKSAFSLYLADVAPPDLGDTDICYTSLAADYDAATVVGSCGGRFSATAGFTTISTSTDRSVDGTGWIPVDLTGISSGAPVAALPVDPVSPNTDGTAAATTFDDYFYAYGISATAGSDAFEINTRLESTKFHDQMAADGGDNDELYEAGTEPGLSR